MRAFAVKKHELETFTGTVATFTAAPGDLVGDFKATIDLYAISLHDALPISNGNGTFSVIGSHSYLELPGQGDLENEQDAVDVYTITVTISDGNTVTETGSAHV